MVGDLAEAEIIIMADDEGQLRHLAAALISLEHRAYYVTPFWHWGLVKLLAFMVGLYLCVLIPRMRTATAVLATCLWLVVLVVLQLGWQIVQWQWLPMGCVMGLLVFGHAIVALWQYQRQNQWLWQQRANQSAVALARQLCREARYDDAQEALRETDTSQEVLGILYDIGAQQERKRQFDAAILTYRALVQRKRSFRDVLERLQSLEDMQQPVQSVSLPHTSLQQRQPDIAKTLVLENSKVNKPVLGRYEIERELGRGAMGVVYLGLDPKITRRVAIKTLSYDHFAPDQLTDVKARFFREAEAAGRLSHPNIVTIFDVGEEHDLAFIAMDFIDGRPLSDFCQPGQLLEPVQVYRYIADVAEALDYAHQHDVVHRDIKPSNMLFNTQADKVTVTDFGIAHITDESRTRTGDILGSPLYMSPEQLKGQAVDCTTDIYSLGVTFYQLLSGVLPFTGDNLASLTYNIIHKDFKSVRKCRKDLPSSATRIINKAMQKDPAKRFANAKEMAEAIRKSLQKDFVEQLVD
jgi:serine/threonine-protein kinase